MGPSRRPPVMNRRRATRARAEWLLFRLGYAGGGRAVGLLSAWLLIQRGTDLRYRLRGAREGGLFLYRATRYAGEPVRLDHGRGIVRGDRLLELHLDNRALARRLDRKAAVAAPGAPVWPVSATLAADLAALAGTLESLPPGA